MLSVCPGCGLELPSPDGALDERYHATWACRELLSELTAYTLTLRDPGFIHQLAIDAYLAQHMGPHLKPIGIAFALVTLHLMFERGYTGRQAQLAHMQLAKRWKTWPRFERTSAAKTALTVRDVIQAPPGDARGAMLARWGKAVWELWQPEHAAVAALLDRTLFLL